MGNRFEGRRVLVTNAERYIGPPIVELFRREGAHVIADASEFTERGVAQSMVERAGRIDILIPNLAGPTSLMPFTNLLCPVTEFKDEDFQSYLDAMVWPLLCLVRAVAPQMIARRSGKIVAVTSASPLRSMLLLSIYTAARGAQNAFIRTVGAELAPHNVQINAIGPAYIENNAYFTSAMLRDQALRDEMVAEIPAGRIGDQADAAELVAALATDASNFLAGQVIPIAGGWVT